MDEEASGSAWGFWVVVVVVLALTTAAVLLIPFIHLRDRTNHGAECASNLHQLGLALISYAQDSANHYPHATADGFIADSISAPAVPVDGGPFALVGRLFPEYIPDVRIFHCPDAPPGSGEETSFGYDPRHLSTHPPAVALVADRPPAARPRARQNSPNHNGDGQHVLYVDCHAEWKKTTNAGYANDEIYVDNIGEVIGSAADNRRDSCVLGYGGSIGP